MWTDNGLGCELELDRMSVGSLEKLLSYFPKAKEKYDDIIGYMKRKGWDISIDEINRFLRDEALEGGIGYLVALCINSALNYEDLFYGTFDNSVGLDEQYVVKMVNYYAPWEEPEQYKALKRDEVEGALNGVLAILYDEPNFEEGLCKVNIPIDTY